MKISLPADQGDEILSGDPDLGVLRNGGYDTSGSVQGVAVAGSYAYLADDKEGLHVIDIADPAKPRHVGSYDTAGQAKGVVVSGNYDQHPRTFGPRLAGLAGAYRAQFGFGCLANLDQRGLCNAPIELPEPDASFNSRQFYRALAC